jgi:hypothetical protein
LSSENTETPLPVCLGRVTGRGDGNGEKVIVEPVTKLIIPHTRVTSVLQRQLLRKIIDKKEPSNKHERICNILYYLPVEERRGYECVWVCS